MVILIPALLAHSINLIPSRCRRNRSDRHDCGLCKRYFCNRCWSHLLTITLPPTASAGPYLVSQLLGILRKMTPFFNLGLCHGSFVITVLHKHGQASIHLVLFLHYHFGCTAESLYSHLVFCVAGRHDLISEACGSDITGADSPCRAVWESEGGAWVFGRLQTSCTGCFSRKTFRVNIQFPRDRRVTDDILLQQSP